MRIAYVINSLEGGGAALPVPAVARVMAAGGHSVEILALTRRDGRALPAMTQADLSVRVRAGGERDHLAAAAWLDHQVGDLRPDLLWTSLTRATLLGQLVGARRRAPVVSWQHNAFLKPTNLALLRATQRLTALWVGDSESVTDLTRRRLGIEPARLATWPLFSADPDAPQAKPWRPGETLQLGTLGRLHPAKGYDVLIAALVRLKAQGFTPPAPFVVRIAGEGAEREALTAQLAQAGLQNLQIAGFTDQPRAFLASLHLYLQPSRREGLCIAAHEAMQAGLPVIVSDVGEMPRSVLPGVSGLVIPPEDAAALADALARLLADPAALEGMGAASRHNLLRRFGPGRFEAAGATVITRAAQLVRD